MHFGLMWQIPWRDSTNVFAQLLSTAEEDGKKAIGEKQSVHLNNERSITDFDDSDQLDRNYFIDVHSSIDKVDNRVPDLEDDKLETLLKVRIIWQNMS